MLFADAPEPIPRLEKVVSGFIFLKFSILELYIIGVTSYVYSMFFAYSYIGQSSLSKYCFKDFKSLDPIFENIFVILSLTLISPFSSLFPSVVFGSMSNELISTPELCICSGYSDRVSSSTELIYVFTPFDNDNISAIPIIPIEPAKDVKIVLPFFVLKLLKLSDSEVKNDIVVFPSFLCTGFFCLSSSII